MIFRTVAGCRLVFPTHGNVTLAIFLMTVTFPSAIALATVLALAALLARIPNAKAGTQTNLEALIANRVLYPDGTANGFVERYLKERVVKLFSQTLRKGAGKRPC